MIEEWKVIKEFPNYMVSSYGRIKTIEHYTKHPLGGMKVVRERIRKLMSSKSSYLLVDFGHKSIKKSVHRLVATAFIPNPDNKPCVNHIDGNGKNNNVSNLEWCTHSENEKHSYLVLGKKPNKTALGMTGIKSPYSKQVAMYSLSGKLLHVFGGATDAARALNGNQGRISTNCRGETRKCYGHIFRYISKQEYLNIKNVNDN